MLTFVMLGHIAVGPATAPAFGATSDDVFRFSLSTEPSHFDPARISSSESNYFIVNLLRGLYFLDKAGEAKPEIAEA